MNFFRTLPAIALMSLGLSLATPAAASTPLTLNISHTQVMTMNAPPGTIVVSDPSIADVTIEGSQVFLHGRGFGNTNILIFDTSGNVAYDFDVQVVDGAKNVVTMISGSQLMSTYSCAPVCEVTVHVGDTAGYFGGAISAMGAKTGQGTGTKTSDGSGVGGTVPPPTQPPAQ